MKLRRSRAEVTEDNRRIVLEAARAQFIDKGFHGASLDSIAAAAGFSKGVVYSQFGSKDDLFFALLEERIEERRRAARQAALKLIGSRGVVAIARNAIGVSADSLAWQALLLEFRVHAARNPAINARYLALHRRAIAGVAEILADVFERGGERPPLPPHTLATLALAIDTGLSAELLADPRLNVRELASFVAQVLASGQSTARVGSIARDKRRRPRSA